MATISKIMSKLDLGRDEVYTMVMEAQKKGLIFIQKSLEPVPLELMVVGITGRGRSYLRRKYPNQMSTGQLRRDPYNLGVGPI